MSEPICVDCQQPFDPSASLMGEEGQCQMCWENQCDRSWWDTVDAVTRINIRRRRRNRLIVSALIGFLAAAALLIWMDPAVRMDLWCLAALVGGFLLGVWPALAVCVALAGAAVAGWQVGNWWSRKMGW